MKQAIVEIPPEILADAARVITDHGLRIVSSLSPRAENPAPHVRIVIEGDDLPSECAATQPLRTVMITVAAEHYGSQRINRISRVDLVETF